MTIGSYAAAYVLSLAGGWLIAGIGVYFMRKSLGKPRPFFRWIDIWIGFTERAIATSLILFVPGYNYLAAFIGGWMGLKFAANWQRQNVKGIEQISLVSLVGSAISFAVAIGVTVIVQKYWANLRI